jgi:hypothetical protein
VVHLKLASLAFVIAAHFRKCAIVLWLLQTDVVAQPMFDSVRCTALIGLDQVIEKAKPLPADPTPFKMQGKYTSNVSVSRVLKSDYLMALH